MEDTNRRETTEYLRYHFNEEEKKGLARDMAQNVIKVRDLEEEKKSITSQYASKINMAVAESNAAAQKLESGFEMRTIDCEEVFDYVNGTVRIYRQDTSELVKDRTMTQADGLGDRLAMRQTQLVAGTRQPGGEIDEDRSSSTTPSFT